MEQERQNDADDELPVEGDDTHDDEHHDDDDGGKGKGKGNRADDDDGGDDLDSLKKDFKQRIDKAYGERDGLKKELKELKDKLRQQEIDALKEQGKEVEALQAQLKDKDTRIEELEAEVTRLSRDITVRDEFRGYNFRNERASQLAYESIVKDLVRGDDGEWKHKSGKSIADFIKSYSEDEDNQFLFQPKTNRGTGTGKSSTKDRGTGGGEDEGKSLRSRPQSEVLKDIAAGKIKPRSQTS